MRASAWLGLVVLALAAPGCIAWRSHIDPGVAGFPASVRRASPWNLRVRVQVESDTPPDPDAPRHPRTPSDTDRLVDLINDANLVREVHPDIAFVDAVLEVRLQTSGYGPKWAGYLTIATLGLVPYFGGREVLAVAELADGKGRPIASWTSRAEVRLVAHLLLLNGWNTGAVAAVRDDALKGVVVRLAKELEQRQADATR